MNPDSTINLRQDLTQKRYHRHYGFDWTYYPLQLIREYFLSETQLGSKPPWSQWKLGLLATFFHCDATSLLLGLYQTSLRSSRCVISLTVLPELLSQHHILERVAHWPTNRSHLSPLPLPSSCLCLSVYPCCPRALFCVLPLGTFWHHLHYEKMTSWNPPPSPAANTDGTVSCERWGKVPRLLTETSVSMIH